MKRVASGVSGWRLAALSLAVALTAAMTVTSARAASASSAVPQHARPAGLTPQSVVSLSLAPAGLRAAVTGTLGKPAPSGGWSQRAKLTAGNSNLFDNFGQAVAIDGSTAVVGAPFKNDERGAAYVFVRAGKTWSERAELTASDGEPRDLFGYSVAVSGSTVVVGAPEPRFETTPSSGAGGRQRGAGAAYVFARAGKTWSQQAELTASNAESGDLFGNSVAVSGTTVAVGAPDKNTFRGAVVVFVRAAKTWSQQAELTASDGEFGDAFGRRVAVSGTTVVVGAPFKDLFTGAAYVFARAGKRWSQQAKLTAANGERGDGFGFDVAIDGTTAVVGEPFTNDGSGAAYVFARVRKAWSQQAELTASNGEPDDLLGVSVAVSGTTALAGASFKGGKTGATYVFARSGKAWSQQAELTAHDGDQGDEFGGAVAVSASTALVGARGHSIGRGAAYVFVRS